MKIKILSTMIFLFAVSITFAQQKKSPAKKSKPSAEKIPQATETKSAPTETGAIFFETTSHNFDQVDEELGRVHFDFNFKNIGKGELRILDITTGCGCTSAQWNKNGVYKHGESDRITIIFNPDKQEGLVSKTITVVTDGYPKFTYLTIEGNVSGPTKQFKINFPYEYGATRLSKNIAQFLHTLDSKHDSMQIAVYNSSNKRIQVLGVRTPPYVKTKIFNQYIDPKTAGMVGLFFYPELAKTYGPIEDQLVLVTDEKEMPAKTIFFKASIEEDFSKRTPEQIAKPPVIEFKEKIKDLGEVYSGEVVEFEMEVTNKGKGELILRRAYGTCGCTVAKVQDEPIKKGKKGKIFVKFNARDLVGIQNKTVTVISNDPVNPITTFTVKASIKIPGMK